MCQLSIDVIVRQDAVCLRFPVRCDEDVIAPDLMAAAAECGMETGDFDENVSMFLEGTFNRC